MSNHAPDIDVIKTNPIAAAQFEPVKHVIETLNIVGWSIVVNFNLRGYEHFASTYPDEWATEYVNGNYNVQDPTVVWASFRQGMCRWSETGIPDMMKVLRRAKVYDLNFGGIWSRKTGKKRTMLFVGKADREFNDEEMELISDAMNPFFTSVGPDHRLTDGEIDALKLLIVGASTADIANDLGITESAVKARVSSARSKLGCKTTPQMIYQVTSSGMLM